MPETIVGEKTNADSVLHDTLRKLHVLEDEIEAALAIIEADRDPYEDVRSYSLTDLAAITGTPRSTLDEACRKGHLKSFIPNGNKQGRRVTMPWYRAWQEACVA
jgi:hypothetical protein